MIFKNQKTRLPVICGVMSILAHILAMNCLGWFGRFDLSLAKRQPSYETINVVLSTPPLPVTQPSTPIHDSVTTAAALEEDSSDDAGEVSQTVVSQLQTETTPVRTVEIDKCKVFNEAKSGDLAAPESKHKGPDDAIAPPLRLSREFLGTSHEKLVYRISMLGMPVGSAELEANNEKGDVWITLRVKSDAVLSTIYPVDDLIETRHINGNFILSRIRQQEGAFRGDRGFTIFLRDKSVFWIDRLTNRSLKEPLPNAEVLDILSGLYFLRNRQLQVGTTETLHIYDSDNYAAIPVDIIRRETVTLPAFREVGALLLKPRFKTGGIFRRTGDVRIWLSDDRFKVPVKIITSIAIGQVTIELMSAESKQPDRPGAEKQFPLTAYSATTNSP